MQTASINRQTELTFGLECTPVQTAGSKESPSVTLLGKPWSCTDGPWSHDSLCRTPPAALNTRFFTVFTVQQYGGSLQPVGEGNLYLYTFHLNFTEKIAHINW